MKILFILGLIGSLASAGMAFYTRSQKAEARRTKDTLNRQIVKVHEDTDRVIGEIKAIHDTWKETKTNAKNEKIASNKAKKNTEEKDGELKTVKSAHEEVLAKRQQMNDEINRILGANGTPEEVLAKVEALKGEIDVATKEDDTLTKDLDVAKKALADAKTKEDRFKDIQAARDKAIRLGATKGTVGAVNTDWGFVVVNMGSNQGVTVDSKLLVKRGLQMIGRVNILQINSNQTVADIKQTDLVRGQQILPGDTVVFEAAGN
ncbi:MAG: hypothetical protein DVB22_001185 [Verrucomicrobia bacterium]|jgi:hypothetical protein|nr:MAG: hypothetical protein DVB22_001185 [Verrucomicrobiota bacterium]